MAVSKKYIPEERILDLRNHDLYYLSIPSDRNNNTVVLLDDNNIPNFENIIGHRDFILQISVANNCLISLKGVSNFWNVCVLNLSNNFIHKIEDLFELKNLTWLNLSGNQIKIIENLDKNVSLEHLDLSYNCIQILGNLSHLLKLKSLLLHGNLISSFKSEVCYFPANLLTLSFAENEITDIKQISQLSFLSHLEQLSVMGNPCARNTDNNKYKNYILSCCKNLKVLDGIIIQNTANEVEKHTHSISTLNNICHTNATQPYLSNISPESMINKTILRGELLSTSHTHMSLTDTVSTMKAKTKTSCNMFPYSILEKEESIFKKDSLAVSYSTHSPERISYQSEQEVVFPKDDKKEKFSSFSNFLCSSIQANVNSLTELTTPHYSDMESVRNSKEIMSTDTWQKLESKYEAYDNRPVRPLSKNAYKTISDSSYLSCSPPQVSMKEPVISNKKRLPPHEFVSQTFNCDESSGQEIANKSSTKKVKPFPDNTTNALLTNAMPATTTTTDSAFGSECNFSDSLCMHRAATQIQALWRGFQCRNLNPKTKYAYLELRCMRAQQHITKLSSDVKQQKDICEQKNYLLKQFLEIVQLMWKELQLRKNTKQDDFFCKSCKNCSSEHLPTTFNTQQENLQKTCHTLNIQVKHLHETLHMFMMGNFLCHPENNADHPELYLKNGGLNSLGTAADTGYWSYVLQDQANHELKDFKDSIPDTTPFDTSRYVSVPDCLTLLPLSENSIMLSWSPSTIQKIDKSIAHTILGYKIYINDHPMAFVPANKTQLIVSNLHTDLTYMIYVTSISTLQESEESQRLIANYYMKNAAKERNVFQSDDKQKKSIPEVNETQNNLKSISNQNHLKSGICSNSNDFNTKLEHKKPTVAEVVEQRFRECSKNVSLRKDCGISQPQKYEHLKTKSKSLENMADCLVNETKLVNCSLSVKQQTQTESIFSDEEDQLEEGENKSGKKENNYRLLNLLEKLYSFSILQKKKTRNLPKHWQPGNLAFGCEEFSQISETADKQLQKRKLSPTAKNNVSFSSTESCKENVLHNLPNPDKDKI